MKLKTMSYKATYIFCTVLLPVICDHSLNCAARAADAAVLFRLRLMTSIVYFFRIFQRKQVLEFNFVCICLSVICLPPPSVMSEFIAINGI